MSKLAPAMEYEHLSIAERILLVEEIWDSIAAEQEQIPLTQAQKDELDRRLADMEKNPGPGLSWEEVRERIWAKK